MLANATKRKLAEGGVVLGVGSSLNSPLAAETLALAGFDFVLVDNQHGAWDDETNLAAFRSICLGGATPMIRVQKNDYATIGRALDRGALGIIVPMVNSADEARRAARAARFPPRGDRSIGPFGTEFHGLDYLERIDDEVYLAVQIETAVAAQRAEEILAVDGVDGCWVGPGDLGLTMGVDLSTADGRSRHEAAILDVLKACRETGKVPGIACMPENAGLWLERGFRFVTVGSEMGLLKTQAAQVLASLRDAKKP